MHLYQKQRRIIRQELAVKVLTNSGTDTRNIQAQICSLVYDNKIAVTPANITDNEGFKHICPGSGAVYADKGYCLKDSVQTAKRKNVHLAAIKKDNMRDKNRNLDRWITKSSSPYERVFSKQNRRVRYVGIIKNQFAEFMQAICFNLRRITVIKSASLLV